MHSGAQLGGWVTAVKTSPKLELLWGSHLQSAKMMSKGVLMLGYKPGLQICTCALVLCSTVQFPVNSTFQNLKRFSSPGGLEVGKGWDMLVLNLLVIRVQRKHVQ